MLQVDMLLFSKLMGLVRNTFVLSWSVLVRTFRVTRPRMLANKQMVRAGNCINAPWFRVGGATKVAIPNFLCLCKILRIKIKTQTCPQDFAQ